MKKTLLSLGAAAVLLTFVACGSGNSEVNTEDTNTPETTEAAKDVATDGEKKGVEKQDKFSKMDADADAMISEKEFSSFVSAQFSSKDANKDGKIQKEECGHFDVLNTDGDDVVTEEEFNAGLPGIFASMDADSDGFISKEELTAHMTKEKADADNHSHAK